MKHKDLLKQQVLAAIITALTVAMSILVVIPVPATHGLVTLCEVGIYTSAILFGNPVGFMVGGASGFLIDIISGYPVWCLFSLAIHGLQGFTVAFLSKKHKSGIINLLIPLLAGSVIMVVGYYLSTSLLFGWPAGLASIPGNLLQVGFGIVVTILVVGSLRKIKPNWAQG
ncbi:ECF transporter S component [Companilactobacillus mishanensis]|uniref:ECF transporter S component n=1 Tax=Companilactobacillus mishanensis TaxID=2486008 RepID=A0A5P0ZIW9_9LACO|nr:ECF transporter S component [Companilactobacillus mishanensis]MQS44708.1 ECF transporter S component [Companilactobacillus mishanensis]MQS52982.1 ECF transporter S component [Companilactobacillus mishanensis]MQS89812.1 ECF transporter S component [Companilactobacillus mishanensis]